MNSIRRLKKIVREDISIQDFFTSEVFNNHLREVTKMVSLRFNDTKLNIDARWDSHKETVAYTNDEVIYINLDNCIVNNVLDIGQRYLLIMGFLGHEIGHVLYTDFNLSNKMSDVLKKEYSLVDSAFLDNDEFKSKFEEYRDYLVNKSYLIPLIKTLIFRVNNIIEDKYVNDKIMSEFPGTFKLGITKSLNKMFAENPLNMDINFSNCVNYIHRYLEIGLEPDINIPNFELIRNIIDKIDEYSDYERWQMSSAVIIYLWDVLKPELDSITPDNNNGGSGSDSNSSATDSNESDSNSSATDSNESDSISDSDSVQNSNGSKLKQSNSANPDMDDNGSSNDESNNTELQQAIKKITDSLKNQTAIGQNDTDLKSVNSTKEKNKFDNSTEMSQNLSCDDFCDKDDTNNTDNNKTRPDEFKGGSTIDDFKEPNLKTIEELLNSYTTKYLRDNYDEVQRKSNTIFSDDVKKIPEHQSVKYSLSVPCIKNKEQFNQAYNLNKNISRRLQRDIKDLFDDMSCGGKLKNLPFGRTLDVSSIVKNDGRYFSKKIMPEDEPQLAVSLLIDESGSMMGDRINQALKMAMIMADFCDNLNIPLSIVGHSVRRQVELKQYIDFNDNIDKTKYRLSDMFAGGCNRDGFALQYCLNKIAERDEPTRLLIIVSDGQPNDANYWGKVAKDDLQRIAMECKHKGITLFAAAIGDDKLRLKEIYGDAFLDITDINLLPHKMVTLVKKFIK